jgi:hypothetical protein
MRRGTDGKDAGRRMAYLILEDVRAKDGGYVPCLAREGEKGYYLTNWNYGLDKIIAEKCIDTLNRRMGLSEEDVTTIVLSSMGKQAA